ncbi:hypothetical protein MMC10_001517 [Thelotrema lepadinum]|nr:hypothetical protein [Thelotrema lepadinum]
MFVDEMITAYPEAKIILTTRSPDSWMESMEHSFFEVMGWRSLSILALFDREPSLWDLLKLIGSIWGNGDLNDRQAFRRYYTEHNKHVRSAAPLERLLEFHPSQGWEPLCKFLDVPIPAEPFPHANEGNAVVKINAQIYWSRWICVAKYYAWSFVAVGVVLGALLIAAGYRSWS